MTAMIVSPRKPKHRRSNAHTEIHVSANGELIRPHMRIRVLAETKTATAPVQVSA